MFFVKILGPVIGLLVGSKLNEIYYTFDRKYRRLIFFFELKVVHNQLQYIENQKIFGESDPLFQLHKASLLWILCGLVVGGSDSLSLGIFQLSALLFFPSLALFLFPSDNLDEDEITDEIALEKAKLNGDVT
ncbi:unnamed protein product [Strongylus vulgaris]|uniref:Uncharacterized protein n=1 Tax=Strongylus vulgaris TaxID=40348 RepID=A0A3P7L1K0_STRVU|nr:unnamed protein product [Strongylus vulgaris]